MTEATGEPNHEMRRYSLGIIDLYHVHIGALAEAISPDQAASHVGQTETVCGTVASTHYAPRSHGQPTFLNLGHAYPNEDFTAVIWGENKSAIRNAGRPGRASHLRHRPDQALSWQTRGDPRKLIPIEGVIEPVHRPNRAATDKGKRPLMSDGDLDSLIRMAAFEHVRVLTLAHDHLTAPVGGRIHFPWRAHSTDQSPARDIQAKADALPPVHQDGVSKNRAESVVRRSA